MDKRIINNYLMKLALPLAFWFIVEYVVHIAATHNLMLQLLTLPMMCATPFLAWYIIKQLRDRVMGGVISRLEAWVFGTQLFFFAGLIEAMFIYLYNEFADPNNLYEMQQALIGQYEEVSKMLNETQAGGIAGSYSQMMSETVEVLRKSPIPSAIEAAVNQLSTTLFQGLFLMIPLSFLLHKKVKS